MAMMNTSRTPAIDRTGAEYISRRYDRSLRHETVADVVDDDTEPFNRANTGKDEIGWLGEGHFVGCLEPFGSQNRVPDVA
jgi:hypothetical protein